MSVFETIRTILAVRGYTSEPIPEEALHRIVEAGRLTGSAVNKQPWHFVVVDKRATIERIAALAKSGPYTAEAPVAIAVAVERDSRWAVSDASRAIQSMVLAAWEEGIGSNWVGFGGMTEIADLLEIPERYDVLAILPLGYPVDKIGKGDKRRKPLGDIASRNRFGDSFS